MAIVSDSQTLGYAYVQCKDLQQVEYIETYLKNNLFVIN